MVLFSVGVIFSLVMNCLGYVEVFPFDDSENFPYAAYRVRNTYHNGISVIYIDKPDATFGAEANLSFESGVMLLNGSVVLMKSASKGPWDRNFVLEAVGQPDDRPRSYLTSGYELGKGEQTNGLGTFDPILYYSQNSHLVCHRHLSTAEYPGSQFQGYEDGCPYLFLFPYFPWLEGCTRVKLFDRGNHPPSAGSMVEFSPTNLYDITLIARERAQRYSGSHVQDVEYPGLVILESNPIQGKYPVDATVPQMIEHRTRDPKVYRLDQGRLDHSSSRGENSGDGATPSTSIDDSAMGFTVLCRAEDRCQFHGSLIRVDKDGYLTVRKTRRDEIFDARVFADQLVESGPMERIVSVEVYHETYLKLRAGTAPDRKDSTRYKFLEKFNIRDIQSDIDKIQLLALGTHVLWMLCDKKIIPIKGRSDPACFEIMIQAHPVTEVHAGTTPATSIDNLRQIGSPKESNLLAFAQQRLANSVGDALPFAFQGELHFACLFEAPSGNFPCGGLNVEIPMIDLSWKGDRNYLYSSGNQAPQRRVMVTAENGLVQFSINDTAGVMNLNEDDDFLTLSNARRAAKMNVSLHRLWKPDTLPGTLTADMVIAVENTSVLYLCRELIKYEMMYFILRRPRSNSSLCTLVVMFIRSDVDT